MYVARGTLWLVGCQEPVRRWGAARPNLGVTYRLDGPLDVERLVGERGFQGERGTTERAPSATERAGSSKR